MNTDIKYWKCMKCGHENPPDRMYSCKNCYFPKESDLQDFSTKKPETDQKIPVEPEFNPGYRVKKPGLQLVAGPDINIGRHYFLDHEYTVIGSRLRGQYKNSIDLREMDSQKWISDPHAVIHYKDNILEIKDQSSTNGTILNRTRLEPEKTYPVEAGDKIRMGHLVFRIVTGN